MRAESLQLTTRTSEPAGLRRHPTEVREGAAFLGNATRVGHAACAFSDELKISAQLACNSLS